MNIKITYKVSETERHIYGFEVYSKKDRVHVSTMISHRDGVGDVWGDKWIKHFAKERAIEVKACEEEFESVGSYYGDEIDYYHPYIDINKKYNPCCLKTKHGKTRYSGCCFGWSYPKKGERYALVPSNERINQLIDKEIAKKYL